MKESKIKRNELDYLMTDCLPVELSPIYSNRFLYSYLMRNEFIEKIHASQIKKNFAKTLKDLTSFPLRYNIKKNGGGERVIGLPQPIAAMTMTAFISLYKKDLFSFLPGRDSFSVRYPQITSSVYYQTSDNTTNYYSDLDAVFDAKIERDIVEHSGAFFNLVPFPRITNFYSSSTQLKTAIRNFGTGNKYKIFEALDFENCFPSIYTHAFSWMIFSEGHEGKSASINTNVLNILDSVCEQINGSETHGLMVGPEFSRFAAEIALENIDCEARDKLLYIDGLEKGRDYQAFRYVDDYFIFAKNQNTADTIKNSINKCAQKFGLHFNAMKETTFISKVQDKDYLLATRAITLSCVHLMEEIARHRKNQVLIHQFCQQVSSLLKYLKTLEGKKLNFACHTVWTIFLSKIQYFHHKGTYLFSHQLNKKFYEFLFDLICSILSMNPFFTDYRQASLLIYDILSNTGKYKDIVLKLLDAELSKHQNILDIGYRNEYPDFLLRLSYFKSNYVRNHIISIFKAYVQDKNPINIATALICFKKLNHPYYDRALQTTNRYIQQCCQVFFKESEKIIFDRTETWGLMIFNHSPLISDKKTKRMMKKTLEDYFYPKPNMQKSQQIIKPILLDFMKADGRFIQWNILSKRVMPVNVYVTKKSTKFRPFEYD